MRHLLWMMTTMFGYFLLIAAWPLPDPAPGAVGVWASSLALCLILLNHTAAPDAPQDRRRRALDNHSVWWLVRYHISSSALRLALWALPDGRYKRELVGAVYGLRDRAIVIATTN